jgi:DNA polymerase-3 subunit beta
MHLTVNRSTLFKELNLIQGVVEKKSTIPILSNLLLEAKDGALTIKGTDLDVSITTWCEAEVTKEGSNCIQAKKLFEIVRALPEAQIELKRGDNDQISINCERSRFKMLGLAKDKFPEIKEFKGAYIAIPADLLKTFISRTLFAITNEESRYALNGAKFEFSGNNIRMVATDGHRLSFIEKAGELAEIGDKIDVLIPKKTLAELSRLCAETDDIVEFSYDDNHLFFKVGKRLLISRTLSGQFPNYELVLTKDNTNTFVIESERISSAIRRVALMSDERSHAVKFDVGDGQLNITSQAAEVGEAGELLPIDYAGPAITTGFNAQYLLDFFAVTQSEMVNFEFKDGNSRAQLKEKGESDYNFRYIVMPMRL